VPPSTTGPESKCLSAKTAKLRGRPVKRSQLKAFLQSQNIPPDAKLAVPPEAVAWLRAKGIIRETLPDPLPDALRQLIVSRAGPDLLRELGITVPDEDDEVSPPVAEVNVSPPSKPTRPRGSPCTLTEDQAKAAQDDLLTSGIPLRPYGPSIGRVVEFCRTKLKVHLDEVRQINTIKRLVIWPLRERSN
jgi:hypothetical protein